MATQVSLTDGAVASAGALAIQTNGTTQAVSISTGQVATLAQNPILTSGTANGVVYLNGSKAATSGSAVTYNGTTFATTADATISGLTVGKGAGAVSTNTAVGASALATNSTGVSCTAVGYQALQLSTVDGNTAIGRIALQATSTGAQNTAVGSGAAPLNTTGTGLVAIGANALGANTTGSSNVGVGRDSLASNTTASNNTAVGYQAGYSNTTGYENVFVGRQAGYSSTTAIYNTYVGDYAGQGSTGTNNTYIGSGSGYLMTSGAKNTILGRFPGIQGGLDIRTASNYIVLSDGDGNPAAWRDGTSTIGKWKFGLGGTTAGSYEGVIQLNGADTTGRGPGIYGDKNGTNYWGIGSYSLIVSGTATWLTMSNSGGGGVYLNGSTATSWTAVSDETRKVIIEPITDAANKVATLRTVIGRLKTDDETVRRPYLIAQDVQAVLPEAVSENEDKEGIVLGLSYTEVIPLLVAAIKELKVEFDAYKATHP